jgi:hypothetical protein
MIEERGRIEPVAICDPSDSARRDAREFPCDVVLVAKNRLLRDKKPNELLADVAEAD